MEQQSMAGRKKGDKTPRRTHVRQVCVTPDMAEMLDQVAAAQYKGLVSHALLALIQKPLARAYKQLQEQTGEA